MPARAIMFMGTGSDVGKSLIVAGLCRLFADRGLRVAPFKPQNMSNNAAAAEGGEIGRAQALQARAARRPASVHMNPVLLKPQSETGAQVVVRGRVAGTKGARAYQGFKRELLPLVLDSFALLKAEADLVLVEGAGSAAEINLRRSDIANMGFAEAADVPVVLIGDIGRGGVIASLVGTKHVLSPDDAARIRGFVVNRMRGDPALFADGMAAIARMTGWEPLGLVPHYEEASCLPAEDALGLAALVRQTADARKNGTAGPAAIAVPLLPRIANFDDLDPLRLDPSIALDLVEPGRPLPAHAQVILLPGSKTTMGDLAALRAEGWDTDIRAHVRRGGHVFGICGGYQMLGRRLSDPLGIEGPPGSVEGLGLLDVETEFAREKIVREVRGTHLATGAPFAGYEIHAGRTTGPDTERPAVRFEDGRGDGATSPCGRVAGCHVHGLFASGALRGRWLAGFGASQPSPGYEAAVEAALDGLAAHLARHIETERLISLAR